MQYNVTKTHMRNLSWTTKTLGKTRQGPWSQNYISMQLG